MKLSEKLRVVFGASLSEVYRRKPTAEPVKESVFNMTLGAIISDGKPRMIARLGVSEADALLNYLEILNTGSDKRLLTRWRHKMRGSRVQWSERTLDLLVNNAGFFPRRDEAANHFARRFLEDFAQTDCVGVWGFVPGEQLLIERQCRGAVQFKPGALEPFYFSEPWSRFLADRKVLIVHPFAESIRAQYDKRDQLFANTQVLPEFELLTVRAVQSLGGCADGFSDWFEALSFMQSQIDRVDFDVALIGAGAYGLPLCAHVKKRGKISIQMGGALQILFGIKGRRWDNMPAISQLYNEHWVRPSKEEQILSADKVEDGCYW